MGFRVEIKAIRTYFRRLKNKLKVFLEATLIKRKWGKKAPYFILYYVI